ncbi:MAG: phosphoribosylformylglycinamidine cyclo-ligase [Oscillospiraceae bacterium]|nr:phosphoribosylformylglycinamidine cyclo-ligase [Oscillospiraceae bacterium]
MDNINYESAGVSIETANDTKEKFKDIVSSKSLTHCTPINRVGAFASLVEINLKNYENPVFVLKSEEPGSKQMLSIDNNKIEWIARDLINHLINDIIVMGATPCAVLDTIICGKFEKDTVLKLVDEMSKACLENGCILVGGETSEQPGMLPSGRYVLQASVLGIADKSKIIDGNNIKCGDAIIALASNGLHTNGYSLVRKLIETKPEILNEKIDGEDFLDNILKPHTSYYNAVKVILEKYFENIHGMAHITGGSINDNLIRILNNDGLQANIDLSAIKIPPVFSIIKNYAGMTDDEMLNDSPFNNGVGLIVAADEKETDIIIDEIKSTGINAYRIGQITKSVDDKKVVLYNKLIWN